MSGLFRIVGETRPECMKETLAQTFDRLVESNLALVSSVRNAIRVLIALAVLSVCLVCYSVYSMSTMRDMVEKVMRGGPCSRGD